MSEPDLLGVVPSTLKRPTKKQLRAFHAGMIDPAHTVRLYLERSYSLAICCKDCGRLTEWTPADLAERFSGKEEASIRDVAPRLKCSSEPCGSTAIAVFPHLFDGVWTWK